MKKQLQIFENQTGNDLIIHVEMNPDRYILKPGDVMHIAYDHAGEAYGLHTIVHDDGLQIYLEHFEGAIVTINGKRARPWAA